MKLSISISVSVSLSISLSLFLSLFRLLTLTCYFSSLGIVMKCVVSECFEIGLLKNTDNRKLFLHTTVHTVATLL